MQLVCLSWRMVPQKKTIWRTIKLEEAMEGTNIQKFLYK